MKTLFSLFFLAIVFAISTADCSVDDALACSQSYSNCTNSKDECTCNGLFALCIYDAGCVTSYSYQQFLNECQTSGCSSSQCSPNNTIANCSSSDLEECNSEYSYCAQNATNEAQICECVGFYANCLSDYGCFYGVIQQDFIQECEELGCPSSICQSSNSTNCSSSQCNDNYVICENSNSSSCDCLEEWALCLNESGCLTEQLHNEFEYECQALNCSSTQCNLNGTTYNCTYSQQYSCFSVFESCSNSTNTTGSICGCYGDYLLCLYDFGCDQSNSSFSYYEDSCISSGCTTTQCTANATFNFTGSCYQANWCSSQYYDCLGNSSSSPCDCYVNYGLCLYGYQCLDIPDFLETCGNQNCSASVCAANGTFAQNVTVCDKNLAPTCFGQFDDCISANGTLCECYGLYGACLNEIGCLVGQDYDLWKSNCELLSCTASECNGNVSMPCNETLVEMCEQAYDNCEQDSCLCFGNFGACMFKTGCMDGSDYFQRFLTSCEASGCSTQSCFGNSTCDEQKAEFCTENYSSCSKLRPDETCTCNEIYGDCLKKFYCLSGEHLKEIEKTNENFACAKIHPAL